MDSIAEIISFFFFFRSFVAGKLIRGNYIIRILAAFYLFADNSC